MYYLLIVLVIVLIFLYRRKSSIKKPEKKDELVDEDEIEPMTNKTGKYEKLHKELHEDFVNGISFDEFKNIYDDDTMYLAIKQLYTQAEIQDVPLESITPDDYATALKDI